MERRFTALYKPMNINLDPKALTRFKHGRLIDRLYNFEVRWTHPENITQPYEINKSEVKRFARAIKNNARIEPVVVLQEYGIVAGIHLLEAFKQNKYERMPYLYGKIKK